MVTRLDWTNESPEYRHALDEYVENIFNYVKDQDYSIEQVNSLTVAAACESTSMMLDPEAYLRARGVTADDKSHRNPDEEGARAFVDVQTERFKWILEDAISRDYNIATELLRKRRLDA